MATAREETDVGDTPVNVTNYSNPFMSMTEVKENPISFAEWLREYEVTVNPDTEGKSVRQKQSQNPFLTHDIIEDSQDTHSQNVSPSAAREADVNYSDSHATWSDIPTTHDKDYTPVHPSTPVNSNHPRLSQFKNEVITSTPAVPPHYQTNSNATAAFDVCDEPCKNRNKTQGRRSVHYDLNSDSEEESSTKRERIPVLKPGQFDGSSSWREFLHRFGSCAKANHWSADTMTVQLRFCLVGAAGAVVHKNPRSSRWDYKRIVAEIDAVYGPSSQHAASIGVELRRRVRKPGESLHALRDDIYEKISIVYADRSEAEQDTMGVEVFINAMGDAELVQKLLEKNPRTLAKAYEIAHNYETTKRAAASVTHHMQYREPPSERRARAATIRESDSSEPEQVMRPMLSEVQHREPEPVLLSTQKPRGTFKKNVNWDKIRCHNCQGIGHMKRRCPSPRQPVQARAISGAPNVSENQNAPAVLCVKSSSPEMCIHVLLYDKEISALLDSGARRNVLPSECFDNIDSNVRPSLQASMVQSLQGISSANVNVRGEVYLPIQIGSRTISVNFLVADVAENTEAILGHPFLEQSRARLDFGSQKIVLFGEQVPYFNPDKKPKVHIVRIARTTVLESGYEYIVPGNAYFREPIGGDVLLSPTKGFVEKHRVLMARVVVDTPPNNQVPIRLYNPGAAPVRVKKGTIAGVLQTANVVQPLQESAEHRPTSHNTGQNCNVPVHLQQLYADSCNELKEAECCRLAELLSAYRDVFSTGPQDLGRTGLVKHDIQTLPGPPVKQHPRRMAFEKQVDADSQIQASLESGLASPSQSSWASPIVMVRKKDQTFRMCVDYRALNERTVKDAYPLPRIQDTLDTLSTAKWFSTLDLASGYWQVELTPRAKKAAAFCSRKGLFEWNIMPFGLCNAPATFQRLMDRVLVGLQWETCLVYLDDIIILGSDVEEMLQRLSQVFDRLRQANLKLKPGKCCLFHREVAYLGHIVSANGVATDPQKILKTQEWPVPTSVSEVRQFVGLASYYRRFIRDFAAVACPLYELTKKNASFRWTPPCQEAFEKLKNLLTSAPILGYPRDRGELILDTDASNVGIGSVLSQVQDGEERVLAYGSRRLSTTEQNYCTTRRELLAVVEFATHFRQYLLGRHFIVRTDHSSLQWLIRMKEPEGQLARWLEKLGEYDFQVVHRPGRYHGNADSFSRRPCREICPCKVPDPNQSKKSFAHQAVQCDLGPLAMDLTTESLPPVMDSVGVDTHKPSGDHGDKEAVRVVQGVCSSTTSSVQQAFHGWSQDELQEAQRNDLNIAPIIKLLEDGQGRPPWVQVSHLGAAAKSYWSQWDRLYLRDDILLRRFYKMEDAVFYPQIILPQAFQDEVLKQMHDGPVGGHFGVKRTLDRLETRYYWFGMKQDVTVWCRTCKSCAAKARPRKTPRAPMGTVRVGVPMERIAIDLMGPMNETDRYNRYILVVQDYFTKWVEAYPLPDEQAVTVAEVLVSQWVCRFGAPQVLHSDQGSNFQSEVFQRMCQLLGVEKTNTTPFRPQSDGQVERFNATLQKILSATAERCHWEWDLMIPFALMAYRATTHSSTGFTPNMMLFGREVAEPIDLVVGLPPGHEYETTPPQYVLQLRHRFELAHQIARDALGQSVQRAKKQYDKHAHRNHYNTGDAVWYLIKGTKRVRGRITKFLPSYDGPYFILGQLDDLVYRIQKSPRTKVRVVHHDKLKPFHSRTPLDNGWVLKAAETWQPTETLPPAIEWDPGDSELDLSSLFQTSTCNADSPEHASGELLATQPDTSAVPEGRPSGGSTVHQGEPSPSTQSTSGQVSGGRPRRDVRQPNRFGDWVVS